MANVTLADAVRALKLVKADLDKHKALLQQKDTENENLVHKLASAKTSMQVLESKVSNAASNPPGLEFERPIAQSDGHLEKEAAQLRAQVQELKGVEAEAEVGKRRIAEQEALLGTVKKENDAMKVQVREGGAGARKASTLQEINPVLHLKIDVLNSSLEDFTSSALLGDHDMQSKIEEKEKVSGS